MRRRSPLAAVRATAWPQRRPWRRFLLALALAGAALIAAGVGFFLSTDCWNSRRSLPAAVDDFVFALRTLALQEFVAAPEPFSGERCAEVMAHLDSDADSTVRGAARWRLEQWGSAATPCLVRELYAGVDLVRQRAAIEILGRLRVREALPKLIEILGSTTSRYDLEKVLEAIDRFAEADLAPALIACAERLGPAHRDYARVLESLGRTGAGVDYLLARSAASPGAPAEIFLPLVETRDARAFDVVAEHLEHPRFWIRRGAARALSASLDAAPILLARLDAEQDDFQRELLVREGLSSETMARSRAVAARLAELQEDPVLGPVAIEVLARHDTPWSIAALWDPRTSPQAAAVADRLPLAPRYGPALLAALLEHPERKVRTRSVIALSDLHAPGSARLLEQASAHDPDPALRRYARRLLQPEDKYRLHASAQRFWGHPERPWTGWNPPLHDLPDALRTFHFGACVLSLLFAAALIAGWVRPLEPDRFRFFVAFFLIEGFLGDFLFFDESPTAYLLASGIHTLLLAGFLVQDRAFVRRRFERLAGASVWLLVPALLYVTGPVVADAMRAAAREFSFFAALVVLLALNVAVGITVFVRWLQVPPWLRRGLISGVLGAALVLFGVALAHFGALSASRGEGVRAVTAGVLLVPVALKLVGFLADPRTSGRGRTPTAPSGTTGRLRLLDLGPTTTLLLPAGRLPPALALCALGCAVLGTACWSVGSANLGGWRAGELVGAYVGGTIGALILGSGWSAFRRRHVIQVRDGLLRHGVVGFGAVLARARWRRNPPPDLRVSVAETEFLRSLLAGSRPSAPQQVQRTTEATA